MKREFWKKNTQSDSCVFFFFFERVTWAIIDLPGKTNDASMILSRKAWKSLLTTGTLLAVSGTRDTLHDLGGIGNNDSGKLSKVEGCEEVLVFHVD